MSAWVTAKSWTLWEFNTYYALLLHCIVNPYFVTPCFIWMFETAITTFKLSWRNLHWLWYGLRRPICCFRQGIMKTPLKSNSRFLYCFDINLFNYICTGNYFNIKKFDKIIPAEIKRCSFFASQSARLLFCCRKRKKHDTVADCHCVLLSIRDLCQKRTRNSTDLSYAYAPE